MVDIELCNGDAHFVFWGFAGDTEHMCNDVEFTNHSAVEACCWGCPCNRIPGDPCQVTDCSLNAEWKSRVYKGDEPVVSEHPLMGLIGAKSLLPYTCTLIEYPIEYVRFSGRFVLCAMGRLVALAQRPNLTLSLSLSFSLSSFHWFVS